MKPRDETKLRVEIRAHDRIEGRAASDAEANNKRRALNGAVQAYGGTILGDGSKAYWPPKVAASAHWGRSIRIHMQSICRDHPEFPTKKVAPLQEWRRGILMQETTRAAVSLASIFVSVCLAWGETDAPSPCDQRCTLVSVAKVESQIFSPKVILTGSLNPKVSADVAFRVGGKIAKRFVDVGSHVTKDEVVAELEPLLQQADVEKVQAGLASAQAALTQAKTNFEREDELFKKGFATKPSYDQAQQEMRTQTAALTSAEASLSTAKQNLDYTHLRAPFDGVVTARNAEAGQVVEVGATIFTLAQDGARDAVFDVYDSLLTETPADQTVEISLQTDSSVTARGKVREVSPTVDTSTETVKVKVEITDVPPRMTLGSTVVGVGHFQPRKAVVLPRGALFRWRNAPAAWVLDPHTNSVTPKVVTIDRFAGDFILLAEGLDPGEIVVVAGIQFLHPGQIVDVSPNPAN